MSRVSVIITTKNRRTLLKKALESVLAQTYTDFECIVVVDGSTDGTCQYLNSVSDSRVSYIYIDEKNSKGGNYARNRGIRKASGEFLAFLDDDDEWFPTKLEKQVTLFDDPEVGLVFCGHIDLYDYKKLAIRVTPAADQQGDLSQFVFKFIFCTTSMLIVRKKLMDEIGGFDENLGFWQEYDACIRLCQITKVAFVEEPLMILRHNLMDTQRLTNKYDGWVHAVKYQNCKYSDLIQNLPSQYKWDRKLMIYYEAASRSELAGYKRKERHYLWKIARMTHTRKAYLHFLFNIGINQELKIDYMKYKVKKVLTGKENFMYIDDWDSYKKIVFSEE